MGYASLCCATQTSGGRPTPKKESLVAIFDNVVIPKSKNMAKSLGAFPKPPPYFSPSFAEVP